MNQSVYCATVSVIDDYYEYQLHRFLLLYIPPILFIIGVIGNSLSFIILNRKVMRRISTYAYLAVLSNTDTVVLFVGLLRLWVAELTGHNIIDRAQWICKLINVVGSTVSDYSVWLIIAVTVERFIVVCYPLKGTTVCRRGRAYGVIAALLILLFLVNMHFFWTTRLTQVEQCGLVKSHCEAAEGFDFLVDELWPWVDAFVYSFLPFVVIIVLNSLIILQVARSKRDRADVLCGGGGGGGSIRSSRSAPENNSKLSVMLLTVSFAFLATTLPMNVTLIVTAFWKKYSVADKSLAAKFKLIRTVTELLMYINHSMNFFLYCATGQKFRQELCALFCRHRIDKTGRKSTYSVATCRMETITSGRC